MDFKSNKIGRQYIQNTIYNPLSPVGNCYKNRKDYKEIEKCKNNLDRVMKEVLSEEVTLAQGSEGSDKVSLACSCWKPLFLDLAEGME